MIYHGDAYTYIKETPDILLKIFQEKDKILHDSIDRIKGRTFSEIFLSGSGSSYNATVAVAEFAKRRLGIRVTPVYPTELAEDVYILPKDSIVIGISQQGTSTSIIHTLDIVKHTGILTISMTGEHNTEIISHADENIYIECGDEDAGATTKGYHATVVTLILFFLEFAKEQGIEEEKIESLERQLKKVILNLKKIMFDCENWAKEASKKLRNCKDLIIISESSQRSLLLEGVLKISETCRFPVRGYEANEFMHGMYNAVTQDTEFLYIFSGLGSDSTQLQQLYHYYQEKKKMQYFMNQLICDKNELHINFLNDSDFSILEYSIPLQFLFVLTSKERGIDLNIPKDPYFHHYMGSKIGQ